MPGSLSLSFKRNSLVHLIVDVQTLFCDPSHPVASDNGWNFSQYQDGAYKINQFVGNTRHVIEPFWIASGLDYCGKLNYTRTKLSAAEFFTANHYLQDPQPADFAALKYDWNGYLPEVDMALTRRCVDTVLISGNDLKICVDSTAKGALENAKTVIVVEDLVVSWGEGAEDVRNYIDQQEGWHRLRSDQILDRLAL